MPGLVIPHVCEQACALFTALGYAASATPSSDDICRFDLEYCLGETLAIDAVFHRKGPPSFVVAALGGAALAGIKALPNRHVLQSSPSKFVFESLRFLAEAVSEHFRLEIEQRFAHKWQIGNMIEGSSIFASSMLSLGHPGLRFLVKGKIVAMVFPLWQISDSDGPPSTANGSHYRLNFVSAIMDNGDLSQPDTHVTPVTTKCPLPVLRAGEVLEHFVQRTCVSLREMWRFRRDFFRKLVDLFKYAIEWDMATQTRCSFLIKRHQGMWVLRIDTTHTIFPNAPPLVTAQPYLGLPGADNDRSKSLTPDQIPRQATPEESAFWLHRHITENL